MEKVENIHPDVDYQNEIFHTAACKNSNYWSGEKIKMKCQPQNPTYRLVKNATTNPPNKKPSAPDKQRLRRQRGVTDKRVAPKFEG